MHREEGLCRMHLEQGNLASAAGRVLNRDRVDISGPTQPRLSLYATPCGDLAIRRSETSLSLRDRS